MYHLKGRRERGKKSQLTEVYEVINVSPTNVSSKKQHFSSLFKVVILNLFRECGRVDVFFLAPPWRCMGDDCNGSRRCNLLSLHHRTRVGLCMQRQKKYINDLRVKSLVTCDEMEIFLFCLLMHPRSHRCFWTRVRVHPSSRRETNRQYAFSCL